MVDHAKGRDRQERRVKGIGGTALTWPYALCRDADDDVILGTAVAARADLIVTGDKDLLVLGSYQSIPIITPGICLARIREA